jgi:hypothetical protein
MRLDDATVIVTPICLCKLDLSILHNIHLGVAVQVHLAQNRQTHGYRFHPTKTCTIDLAMTSITSATCQHTLTHMTRHRVSLWCKAGVMQLAHVEVAAGKGAEHQLHSSFCNAAMALAVT